MNWDQSYEISSSKNYHSDKSRKTNPKIWAAALPVFYWLNSNFRILNVPINETSILIDGSNKIWTTVKR